MESSAAAAEVSRQAHGLSREEVLRRIAQRYKSAALIEWCLNPEQLDPASRSRIECNFF